MPDSIYPANLPPGFPAYLGYADGKWPTAAELRAKFPAARIVSLTVTGATLNTDGIDCEPGNPDAVSSAAWAVRKLAAAPSVRPVVYADLESPGYSMREVLAALLKVGVARRYVRVLTAHYTGSPHVCGPATCGGLAVDADGTQWTSSFPGTRGSMIDMSDVNDDFFGAAPVPSPTVNWTEFDMSKIRLLKQGDADGPGEFWAVHRLQALLNMTGRLQGISQAGAIICDGAFGPATAAGVRAVQAHYGIAADGVCGAQTWGVLLTGAA